MGAKDKILCERCHERPATCHICNGNTGKSQDLCETCFQESASPEIATQLTQFQDAIRNGKCQYCGEPAASGSGGFTPGLTDDLQLWCKQCGKDLAEFHKIQENALPKDFEYPFDDESAQEQLWQQHLEREQRQKEFMKQRVAERKKNGSG
jgi:protein-arginine kinase activator protein McsA